MGTILALKNDFDLIVFDIHMEGLDAVGFLSEIRAARPQIRVAALTESPKEPLARSVVEQGVSCLMRKPYEIGGILRLLEPA